jgi:transposase
MLFGELYEVEREAREQRLDAIARQRLREMRARPIADTLREWLIRHRLKVPDGSATAKAIQNSLGHWAALTRYFEDGDLPIDNNWVENRIRPAALGRSNWLFARSLRAGQRAAVVMSLIQSAKLNGHDPYRYLKDALERLPTQLASRLDDSSRMTGSPCQSHTDLTTALLAMTSARWVARTVTGLLGARALD